LRGGVLFLAIEWWLRGKRLRDQVTWPIVFAVATGQLVAAVFPGASPSGSTILLALLLGMNRPPDTYLLVVWLVPDCTRADDFSAVARIVSLIVHVFERRTRRKGPASGWPLAVLFKPFIEKMAGACDTNLLPIPKLRYLHWKRK